MNERKKWISRSEPLALTQQCELTGVARSTIYVAELVAAARSGRSYANLGHNVNRKRVQRLMRMS